MPGLRNIGSNPAITGNQPHANQSPKANKGKFGARRLQLAKAQNFLQQAKALNNLKARGKLLAARKINAQPAAKAKPQIPRSNAISANNKQAALQALKQNNQAGKKPANEATDKTFAQKAAPKRPGNTQTDAMKRLQAENMEKRAKQEKEIENLPTPPKGIKGAAKPQSGHVMSGKEKAQILPGDFGLLTKYISNISTTQDLLETWNGLTHLAIKNEITSLELSLLRDKFANQIRKVANSPKEADLISEKMIKAMVKDTGKQKIIMREVNWINRANSLSLQARLDNLRKS